jgi:4-hydroxybenzoate polyprenyltransferase
MISTFIFQKMEKIINFLEVERLNFIEIFIFIFFISLFRSLIEGWSFSFSFTAIQNAHIVSFYFCVFTGGVLLLKVITRDKLLKIANVTCIGFLILPLAPLLDHFVFHRVGGYDYLPKKVFLDSLLTSVGPPEYAGIGQILMIWLIIIFTSLFVAIKTRSMSKAIVNCFVLYFFILAMSTPTLNGIFNENYTYPQTFFLLYYLILTAIFIILIITISKRGLLYSLIRSLRPLTTLHATIMVLIGLILAAQVKVGELIHFPFTEKFGYVGMSLLAIVFLWWFTVLLNQIYDYDIDRITAQDRVLVKGLLTKSEVTQITILFGILSVFLSLLIGYIIIPVAIGLVLAILYSVPPVRFRNHLLSITFLGLGSSLEFLAGYLTFPTITNIAGRVFPLISYPALHIPLSCALIGIIIFIAFSTGPAIKDLKDYEGDKKSGVKNIYTVFGMEQGLKIVSILLFVSFISPILLFHSTVDVIILGVTSVAVMILFYRYKNVEMVFGMYFLIIIYCLLRWMNVL